MQFSNSWPRSRKLRHQNLPKISNIETHNEREVISRLRSSNSEELPLTSKTTTITTGSTAISAPLNSFDLLYLESNLKANTNDPSTLPKQMSATLRILNEANFLKEQRVKRAHCPRLAVAKVYTTWNALTRLELCSGSYDLWCTMGAYTACAFEVFNSLKSGTHKGRN